MTQIHRQHKATIMARRAPARRAMTLWELAAVVFIIGLMGAMAVTRYGSSAIGDLGAQGFARRVALDCLQARRRAISTGNSQTYLLRFTLSGPNATQYGLYNRQGGSYTLVDDIHTVPDDVTVTPSAADVEFNFFGEAIASYTITVAGPDRNWSVTVPQATGKAFVAEL